MSTRQVLVVEDDDRIRQALIDYLQSASSIRVDAARDGADALHAVSRNRYDVIILDLMMPYMNGIDFLDSLQIVKPQDHPACFIVTGMPADEVPAEAILHRFQGLVRRVFRKPLDLRELGRCVEDALPPAE
jgi:DNA-binding response OmpR family regulator